MGIDLAYLPLEPRDVALTHVRNALAGIAANINKMPDLTAILQDNKPDEMRIIVEDQSSLNRGTQIKIEVSPVARGTLLLPVELDVVASVENEFGFASIKVVSLPDLYGGKLCAALDRQHPRDLFDIKILLENQKIDRELFNGFITYLLSHKRPISEIMNPRGRVVSVKALFRGLKPTEVRALYGKREITGQTVYIEAMKLPDGELLSIASNDIPGNQYPNSFQLNADQCVHA